VKSNDTEAEELRPVFWLFSIHSKAGGTKGSNMLQDKNLSLS
jgi:hypothetical protein